MAVDIIPKAAEKTPLWQSIVFYFSIFCVLMTVASYFLIDSSIKKADKESSKLKADIDRGKTEDQIELEKKVFDYKYKIESLDKLLNERFLSLNFFNFLEKNTHPEIWLREIKVDPRKLQATIIGEGENFQTVGQQISILKNGQGIGYLKINNILINTSGKIDFEASLNFNEQFFKDSK